MTSPRRLEQDLPVLLGELYLAGTPDYRDDLVRQTARVRQRPAWTFPERWLPMELVTTRVPTTRLPWRQLGVLAIIAILLAAMLAVYVGSQQSRVPAPFGPAANGVVAYSAEGDIYVADPTTGDARTIVGGSETDLRPIFSPDGTKIAFERQVEAGGGLGHLYVARSDGSAPIQVTTEPLLVTESGVGDPYQFSPDGRSLVVAAQRGGDPSALFLVATDGTGDRKLDLGSVSEKVRWVTEPTFRPPDGAEISFVGTDQDPSDGGPGVFAVNVATGRVRAIVEADSTHELDLATWSPDGTALSYATWDATVGGLTVRTHIVNADGSDDRMLPLPPDADWDVGAAWSNDGTRLHIVRGYTPGWEDARPVIVPVDGSDMGTEIPYQGTIQGDCCYAWKWSPDDTLILGKPISPSRIALRQVVIDVKAGTIRTAPWDSTANPMIQRRAP
ncbi:MAG TPA: hypothetical protein VGQ89_00470 [Candidatus Limnocylindrales bacterium]|nr:hypothetical protein [Candidatus Limnocylindrales bacterium]